SNPVTPRPGRRSCQRRGYACGPGVRRMYPSPAQRRTLYCTAGAYYLPVTRGSAMPEAQLVGSVVVVTGGASGIGRELAARFAAEGAGAVVVTDRNGPGAEDVAAGLSSPVALGLGLDVSDEAAVKAAIERVETEIGPIDIWLSNAGVGDAPGLGTDDQWD